jgi:hypothetical protein
MRGRENQAHADKETCLECLSAGRETNCIFSRDLLRGGVLPRRRLRVRGDLRLFLAAVAGPGSLGIHVRRAIQEAKRGAVSREQIRRCLVRGYRRRANPGWKDQPEDGPIIERPYRLLP